MVYVPRQAWHGLRNTGTGLLQITWTSAPPGIEGFFRELSRLSAPADAAAVQAIAQRHGIEFRPESEPSGEPPASGHRRRRRHRGRGRGLAKGPQGQPSQSQTPQQPPTARAGQAQAVGVPERSAGTHRRHRRRRRGSRRDQGTVAAPHAPTPQPQRPSTPPVVKGVPERPAAATPIARQKREGGRHRRGRVKEVYMGGRWVQVEGEGPVIAPGKDQSRHTRKGTQKGDEPSGPLSVPL